MGKIYGIRRKSLALLLAAGAAAGVLSGCSGGEAVRVRLDPKKPVSVQIWHYYNGPLKDALDTLVTEFNNSEGQKQGIVVEAFSHGNVDTLTQAVENAAEKKVGAANLPSVFSAYADTAYYIDQMGLAADVGAYMTEEEKAEYVPAYLEEGNFDGSSLKIFPIAKSTELLAVNKTDWDQFASATGASTDSLKTVEGVTEISRQYYEWSDALTPDIAGDGKAFFGRDALANYILVGAKQLGVDLFQVENNACTLNLDPKVMRKIWDNYYIPMVNGWYGAYGKFRSDDMKIGKLSAMVCSTSGMAFFPDKVMLSDTESYDIEPMVLDTPVFEGGEPYLVQQGAGMVVVKSDEKTEYASTVFLKWFTEAQRNMEFSAVSGYLPVKAEANDPARFREVLDAAGADSRLKVTLPASLDLIGRSILYTSKPFGNGSEARNVLRDSLENKCAGDVQKVEELVSGGVSREEAVAQLDLGSEENFSAWLTEISEKLSSMVSAS